MRDRSDWYLWSGFFEVQREQSYICQIILDSWFLNYLVSIKCCPIFLQLLRCYYVVTRLLINLSPKRCECTQSQYLPPLLCYPVIFSAWARVDHLDRNNKYWRQNLFVDWEISSIKISVPFGVLSYIVTITRINQRNDIQMTFGNEITKRAAKGKQEYNRITFERSQVWKHIKYRKGFETP